MADQPYTKAPLIMAAVLASWVPAAPMPQQQAKLAPALLDVPVNTPSGATRYDVVSSHVLPRLPQISAKLPVSVTAVRVDAPPPGYRNFTWSYSETPSVTSVPSAGMLQSVDNPPRTRLGELGAVNVWWTAPPQPFAFPPNKLVEAGQSVVLANPPGAVIHDIEVFADPPLPQVSAKLPISVSAVPADSPLPRRNILPTILAAWAPADPAPQIKRPAQTQSAAVDSPPGESWHNVTVLDDQPLPQLPPKLPASLSGVRVDNPPPKLLHNAEIIDAWLPPPPAIRVRTFVPIPPSAVDNPPATGTHNVVYVGRPPLPQVGPKRVQPFIPVTVDNPPPNAGRQQVLVCSIIAAWNETAELRLTTVSLPFPEQIPIGGAFPRIVADTDQPLPQVSRKLPQSFIPPVNNPPFRLTHNVEIIDAWLPVFVPQQARKLFPTIPPAVDQAPGAWAYDISAVADDPLPQRSPKLPPVVTAVQVDKPLPQQRTNMPTILSAWIPPAPTLQIKVYAPLPSIAVNNPPGGTQHNIEYVAKPPLPQVGPKLAQTFVPPPPDNPTPNARQQVIVRSIVETWQPPWYQPQQAGKVSKPDPIGLGLSPLRIVDIEPPPLPQVNIKLPQPFIPPSVDNPPIKRGGFQQQIVQLWQPPAPQAPRGGLLNPALLLNPSIDTPFGVMRHDIVSFHVLPRLPQQSFKLPVAATGVQVDNPPIHRGGAQDQIVQQWQPPPPQAPRGGLLNPAITRVPVDNPIPQRGGAQLQVVQQWQPPPPQAPLGGLINPVITAVRVDNPPPHDGRAQWPVSIAWIPGPPQPQVLPPITALLPQPIPPPPVITVVPAGGGKLPIGGHRKRKQVVTSLQKAPVVAIQAPAPTPLPPSNLFTVPEAPQPSHPFISELEPHLSALRGDIMQAHHALDEQDAMDILHHLSSPAQPPAAPETSHATDEEDALAILKTLGLG